MWVAGIGIFNNNGTAPMHVTAQYLREQAHHCVALARACPHLSTAQALEALSVELMEKAAEVEQTTAIPFPARSDGPAL